MDGFTKYHFKDLSDNDKILYVLHRNWFYLLKQYFVIFLIIGVFFGAMMFLPAIFPGMLGADFAKVSLFFENTFFLAIWLFGFLIWVDYYFDIWIITEERIVNIEQKGLFMRKVSELRHSKIQDVTTEVVGFLPTIINYGDVRIQTAGEREEFVFRTISDPYHVKSIILELQKKSEAESTEDLGEMIKEKIGA